MELVAERLKLSDDQMERFVQLQNEINEQTERLKWQHRADIEAFWQEAGKDNPDRRKVRELLDRSFAMRKQHSHLRTENMMEFLKELTPEQRKIYEEMIRKRDV